MVTIKVSCNDRQYNVVLEADVKWPSKSKKSKIDNTVMITTQGLVCDGVGVRYNRVNDAVDKVMEVYEEEFKDFSRCVEVVTDGIGEKWVVDELIDYFLSSMFVNKATVNGLMVR